jgi:hypothetical protein
MFCFYGLRTLSLIFDTVNYYAELALILYSYFQLKPLKAKPNGPLLNVKLKMR